MDKLRKQGVTIEPIAIQGRKIAKTFWGEAWCRHLEQFSDFANRLPRGRTYVRNGSVCHLVIQQGKIKAIVSGSELYRVSIDIIPLTASRWKKLRKQCAGQIGSMLELLQGRLSNQVMEIVTDPAKGLFPQPKEIRLHCDCPDWAGMCKHVAAVLYGVGARLDEKPELLFLLRKVDHEELISEELDMQTATHGTGRRRRLANQDLSNLFGIELEDAPTRKTIPRVNKGKSATRQSASKRTKPRQTSAKAPDSPKTFTPTATAVVRLRKQYKMTRTQFAELLGISPQTLANWEGKRGRLNLQAHSLAALTEAWLRKQA
jgi:uncharacterized Zn finger protein